jgi:hypothetical protein
MVLALLLILAVAFSPAAQAQDPSVAPPNDGYKTTYTTKRSKVVCKSESATFNFAASRDAHAEAGESPLFPYKYFQDQSKGGARLNRKVMSGLEMCIRIRGGPYISTEKINHSPNVIDLAQ